MFLMTPEDRQDLTGWLTAGVVKHKLGDVEVRAELQTLKTANMPTSKGLDALARDETDGVDSVPQYTYGGFAVVGIFHQI
jgi:hypothetical protein